MAELKKCFVIAPIGDDGSTIRDHSDTVLAYLINPVIETLGFGPGERADHLGKPGIITTQVVERIANDDLVIADLTGHNPNVFYELAIRHASGRPFIQMIKADEKIPFDVGQQRTIKFELNNLAIAEKAKAELRKQIEACQVDGFKMETPLGYAFDFQKLNATGGEVGRSLALLHEKVDTFAKKQAFEFHKARMLTRDLMYLRALGRGEGHGPQGPQSVDDPENEVLWWTRSSLTVEHVRRRAQRFLAELGYLAAVPSQVVEEIYEEVLGTAALGRNDRILRGDIDVIARRILERRVLPKPD